MFWLNLLELVCQWQWDPVVIELADIYSLLCPEEGELQKSGGCKPFWNFA